MSSRGAVSYREAKYLTKILRLLVGHSPHHIRNTQDIVDQVKSSKLGEGSALPLMMWRSSSHLFHNQTQVEQDTKLHPRTSISIQHTTTHFEFCLKNTYFLFHGKYYEQVHGATMGFLHELHCGQPFNGRV